MRLKRPKRKNGIQEICCNYLSGHPPEIYPPAVSLSKFFLAGPSKHAVQTSFQVTVSLGLLKSGPVKVEGGS